MSEQQSVRQRAEESARREEMVGWEGTVAEAIERFGEALVGAVFVCVQGGSSRFVVTALQHPAVRRALACRHEAGVSELFAGHASVIRILALAEEAEAPVKAALECGACHKPIYPGDPLTGDGDRLICAECDERTRDLGCGSGNPRCAQMERYGTSHSLGCAARRDGTVATAMATDVRFYGTPFLSTDGGCVRYPASESLHQSIETVPALDRPVVAHHLNIADLADLLCRDEGDV